MASRRIRIKGIANIPQRKKLSQENNVFNIDGSSSTILLPNNECDIKIVKKEECTDEFIDESKSVLNQNSCESFNDLPCMTKDNIETVAEKPTDKDANLSNIIECSKAEVIQAFNDSNVPDNIDNSSIVQSRTTETVKYPADNVSQTKEMENQNPQTGIRRKFLKPGINLSAVKKRQTFKEISEKVPTTENICVSEDVKQETLASREETEISFKPTERVVVLSEIRIPKQENKSIPVARDLTKTISGTSNDGGLDQGSEVTLNETHLYANESPSFNSSVVTFSPTIKKIIPETHNVSDTEYPAPPPSPSKINRSRIKAIPRLSQRKTSCSASESEDETRKYGRIRNNSVCSIVSTSCVEPPTPTSETIPPKDVTPHVSKKLNRSEQSRKVAEARREFHKRFGTRSPDKQKLKMIDLIFYNPTTNPMSQKSNKSPSDNTNMKTEKESEETIDDPPKVNVEEKEKENGVSNSMPVPQIKIGPSGEIILDEQSLIVENVEVARQKKQIQNSQLVNGDFDTAYGIYKRNPRSLAWTNKETVRFYKALNLIGTDFALMTKLFPKRTRRELKLKFKKEERINRPLIDKAIMQPCNYNFADLKRQIEIEEQEEAALQKLKVEEMEKMKKTQLEKIIRHEKKRKGKSIDKTTNISEGVSDQNEDKIILPPKKRLKSLPPKIKTHARKTKPILNINSVLDDDDADISDMETQSESEEEETIPFLKPTRSGRMPKSTARFTTIVDQAPRKYIYNSKKPTPENDTANDTDPTETFATPNEPPPQKQQNSAIRNRRSSSLSSIESNSDKLVPGSVVIMMEEDENGKYEYKVYMVTPEKKMAPLVLSSDIIDKLVKERENDEDNAKSPVPPVPEENVTIPATDEKQNDSNNVEFQEPQVPEENVTISAIDEKQNDSNNVEFQEPQVPEENITIPATDDRQNDEDNAEVVVVPVTEEKISVAATVKNVASESQESEEIVIINCPEDVPE